jgi:hypothetical protein
MVNQVETLSVHAHNRNERKKSEHQPMLVDGGKIYRNLNLHSVPGRCNIYSISMLRVNNEVVYSSKSTQTSWHRNQDGIIYVLKRLLETLWKLFFILSVRNKVLHKLRALRLVSDFPNLPGTTSNRVSQDHDLA